MTLNKNLQYVVSYEDASFCLILNSPPNQEGFHRFALNPLDSHRLQTLQDRS